MIKTSTDTLSVKNLSVTFKTNRGLLKAVDNVSFDIKKGSVLGIVGESGSGKTVLSRTLIRLLPETNLMIKGDIDLFGIKVTDLKARKLKNIYGHVASIIFQDPLTALNPVMKVKKQLAETLKTNPNIPKKQIKEEVNELLQSVGIPDPRTKANSYPHQLSGGQRQRVMIASAIANSPQLLIADEPTTALDVTIQLQILKLLKSLQEQNDMTLILITHDLGVVEYVCDYVGVMYAGTIVEFGPTKEIIKNPLMPYTRALIDSTPSIHRPKSEKLKPIERMIPDPFNLPKGCRFAPRCRYAQPRCLIESPKLTTGSGSANHSYACFYPLKELFFAPQDTDLNDWTQISEID